MGTPTSDSGTILEPGNPGGAVAAIPRRESTAEPGGAAVGLLVAPRARVSEAPSRPTSEWAGVGEVTPDDLVIFKLGLKDGPAPSRDDMERFLADLDRAQRAGQLASEIPYEAVVLRGFRRPFTGDPATDPEGFWLLLLGGGEDGWAPDKDDLDQFHLMLNLITKDPDAVLVYHHGVRERFIPLSPAQRVAFAAGEWPTGGPTYVLSPKEAAFLSLPLDELDRQLKLNGAMLERFLGVSLPIKGDAEREAERAALPPAPAPEGEGS